MKVEKVTEVVKYQLTVDTKELQELRFAVYSASIDPQNAEDERNFYTKLYEELRDYMVKSSELRSDG